MTLQVQELKEHILDNNCVEQILEELGCHHIRNKGEYISAANKDGNNTQAIIIYLNENLTCINYTRQIAKNKRTTDIFDLISFCEDCTFAEAMKWVCDIVGIDYYSEQQELPESLQLIKLLKSMSICDETEDNEPLKPISEKVMNYYLPYGNKMWCDERISLETQKEFNIMYDPQSNYIVIPLYDQLGSLVGIKGRYFGEPDEFHTKYTHLFKCNKSKLLYGYWQNKEYIKNSKVLIVVESEKSVLKLAEYGFRNAVAIGGKSLSKYQVELITRTGCLPLLALDKDCTKEEINHLASMFVNGVNVYAVYDDIGILDEKESPMDDEQKWNRLYKECVFKVKGMKNVS